MRSLPSILLAMIPQLKLIIIRVSFYSFSQFSFNGVFSFKRFPISIFIILFQESSPFSFNLFLFLPDFMTFMSPISFSCFCTSRSISRCLNKIYSIIIIIIIIRAKITRINSIYTTVFKELALGISNTTSSHKPFSLFP